METRSTLWSVSRDVLYNLLLQNVRKKDLVGGRKILFIITCDGLESVSVFGDYLIRLFTSCGCLAEANYVFWSNSRPTIFTCNAIISAHVNNGEGVAVLQLFQTMVDSGVKPEISTYLSVLKSCKNNYLLNEGRLVHSKIILSQLEVESSIANSLVDMYARCGSLNEAYEMFQKLCNRNVVSWTIIISAYTQHDDCFFSLELYCNMIQEGVVPNKATFMAALKACSKFHSDKGKIVHVHIIGSGCEIDEELEGNLLDMYSKGGNIDEAEIVFNNLRKRDLISYGIMISGYAHCGDCFKALELYDTMQKEGLKPDKYIYSSLLKACAKAKATETGSVIHRKVMENGLHLDAVVGTALIGMHAQFGNLDTAQELFDDLPEPNEVACVVLMKGYVLNGFDYLAIEIYIKMLQRNLVPSKAICSIILKACTNTRAIILGSTVHYQTVQSKWESDRVIASSIIDLYCQCGCLDEARYIFDTLRENDTMSWGVLFQGYLAHGQYDDVFDLLRLMERKGENPDTFIYMCVLKACRSVQDVRILHDQIVNYHFDYVLEGVLIDAYYKCGSLKETECLFGKSQNSNVVSWTTMINGYAEHGEYEATFRFFEEMQQAGNQPNSVTFLSLLKACSNMVSVMNGMVVHDIIIKSELHRETSIQNSLMDMYANGGYINEMRNVFNGMNNHDMISWSIIIAAYAHNEQSVLALECLNMMQLKGEKPSSLSLLCTLKACGDVGAISQGKLIHSLLVQSCNLDKAIHGALVDMYARCECMHDAENVFYELQHKDETSWGALIAGYAHCGKTELARRCFKDMQRQGLKPNEVVFVNLFTACAHEGLIPEACNYFESMVRVHGIDSNLEHYSCMIDLLSRAGFLKESYDLLQTLPISPDQIMWRSLLTGCKFHDQVELGLKSFGESTILDTNKESILRYID